MKKIAAVASAIAGLAGAAEAGGVDRSGHPIGIIFEQGNYAEFSFGQINPSVSGKDLFGVNTGSVAGNHNLPGLALKYEFNDRLSLGLIIDQSYGADIAYPAGGGLIAGTTAKLDSIGVTGILRYKFDENLSAHAGIRATRVSGNVTLAGPAYQALNGYNVRFDDDWGTGYLIGAAYEKPEIALRLAVTYFSKLSHKLDTTEAFPVNALLGPFSGATLRSVTAVDTPQSVNVDFQTGIMKDTLLFANMRWVDWSDFKIDPRYLMAASGRGLVDLDDTTTWTLGVGRRFNENWSGSAFLTYEKESKKVISPLAPNNGYKGIGIAAVYTQDNMKVTMGARYLDIGDARIGPSGVHVANMTGNHAVAVGVKVGFSF